MKAAQDCLNEGSGIDALPARFQLWICCTFWDIVSWK